MNLIIIYISDQHKRSSPVAILIIFPSNSNVLPTFTEDQTDANLSRLINNQLDLIIGMKDAKFNDSGIQFTLLQEEELLCVMPNEIIKYPDLITFKWSESPHAPLGIYSKVSAAKDKKSLEYAFINLAKGIYKSSPSDS